MLEWQHEGGFSLDASVRIDDWDRDALERLSRYCARPPFAAGRLAPVDEQTVAYELRKPTQDLAHLPVHGPAGVDGPAGDPDPAAAGPPGQLSQKVWDCLRRFGVLAPNAKLREQVVQTAGPSPALLERLCLAAECMGIEEGGGEADAGPGVGPGVAADDQAPSEGPRCEEKDIGRRASRLWAMLIARIYGAFCRPRSLGARRCPCCARAADSR